MRLILGWPRETLRYTSRYEASRYCLPRDYRARKSPSYFIDGQSETTWQPDVYSHAGAVARRFGARRIVDVGCGAGDKLAALHPEFEIVGLDYGPNLDLARARYSFGDWIQHDLSKPRPLPVELTGTVLVAADVVEHLLRPEYLLRAIREALFVSHAAILSTPDRKLWRGDKDLGPPLNPAHVREWTADEFAAFLAKEGLEPFKLVHTRSHDQSNAPQNTILASLEKRLTG